MNTQKMRRGQLLVFLFIFLTTGCSVYNGAPEAKDIPLPTSIQGVKIEPFSSRLPTAVKGHEVKITFQTSESLADIFHFYQDKLTNTGWQVSASTQAHQLPANQIEYIWNHDGCSPHTLLLIAKTNTSSGLTDVELQLIQHLCL